MSLQPETAPSRPAYIRDSSGLYYKIGGSGGGSGSGVTTLDSLTDVTAPTPTTGDILKYTGSAWINSVPTSGGSTILSGTASPVDATGNVGDYYLDTDDRILYGPKRAPGMGAPESILGGSPTYPHAAGGTAGLRFTTVSAGQITALRFWRDASSTVSTRPLTLWTDAGVKLEEVNTTAENSGGAGWKTVTLPTPRNVNAGDAFRVAYGIPSGGTAGYNATAPTSATPNITVNGGCYSNSGVTAFPSTADPTTTYFADVVYQLAPDPWPVALKSVPPGGTTGQMLGKTSNADYAVAFSTPAVPPVVGPATGFLLMGA